MQRQQHHHRPRRLPPPALQLGAQLLDLAARTFSLIGVFLAGTDRACPSGVTQPVFSTVIVRGY